MILDLRRRTSWWRSTPANTLLLTRLTLAHFFVAIMIRLRKANANAINLRNADHPR
jgi:hypothetical protein